MPRILPVGDPTVRRKPLMKDGVRLRTLPERLLKKLSTLPYVDVRRGRGAEKMTIVLPNGESYLLDIDHVRLFLETVGVEKGEPLEKVLDFLFNFRAVTLDLRTLLPTVTYERDKRLSPWGPKK